MRIGLLLIPLLFSMSTLAVEPDHILLDTKRNWEPIVYGTAPANTPADVVSMDLKGDIAKFCSYDSDKRGTFQYRLHIPIEVEKFPFVVLRYRATNVDTNNGGPALYADDSPDGSLYMRPVAALNQLTADGKDQELRIDLRDQKLTKVISGLMICLMATEKQTATIEILEMRFEAAPDAEHIDTAPEAPIDVNVTDMNGTPIAKANVTIDSERKDAARSAKTDAQGHVQLVPLANEAGRHMLQIDGDYLATTMVEIGPDDKGPIAVQVKPGLIYGGVIQDEKGKPIEGATVRIFAPPPDGAAAEHRMIRRAVVRTDKQGRWQSPAMPDEGKDPMFKLAHPDFICDKEYNETPLPPADELKSGIGVMVLKKE